jgi:hypothetical protein
MKNNIRFDDNSSWGIHINRKSDIGAPPCPQWVKAGNQKTWKNKGVIIWNKYESKVMCMFPQQALDVLDDLRESPEWKDSPFCLGWNSYIMPFSEEDRIEWRTTKNRRNRSSNGKLSSCDLILIPEQTEALLLYLEEHQIEIREFADAYSEEVRKVLGRVYSMIIGWGRDRRKKEQKSP